MRIVNNIRKCIVCKKKIKPSDPMILYHNQDPKIGETQFRHAKEECDR